MNIKEILNISLGFTQPFESTLLRILCLDSSQFIKSSPMPMCSRLFSSFSFTRFSVSVFVEVFDPLGLDFYAE